jgi:hypothetical protein
MASDSQVKRFLEEIEEVSRKHNLVIGHEDYHGAFLVEDFDERNIRWLKDANNETKES